MANDFEHRLQNLEEKFEYQDRLIEDLNQVIISQQDTIDRLQTELVRLKEDITSGAMEDVNERPPHY